MKAKAKPAKRKHLYGPTDGQGVRRCVRCGVETCNEAGRFWRRPGGLWVERKIACAEPTLDEALRALEATLRGLHDELAALRKATGDVLRMLTRED